jgi:hypothetical protein
MNCYIPSKVDWGRFVIWEGKNKMLRTRFKLSNRRLHNRDKCVTQTAELPWHMHVRILVVYYPLERRCGPKRKMFGMSDGEDLGQLRFLFETLGQIPKCTLGTLARKRPKIDNFKPWKWHIFPSQRLIRKMAKVLQLWSVLSALICLRSDV